MASRRTDVPGKINYLSKCEFFDEGIAVCVIRSIYLNFSRVTVGFASISRVQPSA